MLMLQHSTLSVIRHLICGSNHSWLLDDNKYNQKLPHIYVMTKWMANNYFFVIKSVMTKWMANNYFFVIKSIYLAITC